MLGPICEIKINILVSKSAIVMLHLFSYLEAGVVLACRAWVPERTDAAAIKVLFHPVLLFLIRLDVIGRRLGPASADLVQSDGFICDIVELVYTE